MPFTRNKFLRLFYDRSFKSGGNRRTVQVSGTNYTDDLYISYFSSGTRLVLTTD